METELERMVIRLVGDGSDYQAMLKQAVDTTTEATNEIKAAADRIGKFGEGLQSFANAATQALASIGIAGGLRGMFDAFTEAETVSIRLNAVLESNGRVVEETREQYNAFANEIQRMTVLDDDATLALLNQAESFNITGQAAQDAVRNAISLASITGGSAQGMIRLTAALAQGDVKRAMQMARMVPQLRGIRNETEFLAKANQLMSTGWTTALAEANSAGGKLKQLMNALGNLMEDFGEIVAEAALPLISYLKDIVAWFAQLDRSLKMVIVGFVGLLGAIISIGAALPILNAIVGPIMTVGRVVLALINPLRLVATAFSSIGLVIKGVALVAGTIFSPMGVAIGAVVVVLAVVIRRLGGLTATFDLLKSKAGAAWDWIKAKTTEFMAWSAPIWNALAGVGSAAWDRIAQSVEWLWDSAVYPVLTQIQTYALSVWESITGGATLNWGIIKDTIVDTLLYLEFSLINFEQVANYTWTGIKLGFIQFVNSQIHFFTETLPAMLNWFATNWREIFTDVFNWSYTIAHNFTQNFIAIFQNLPGLIAGTTDWSEVWRPLTEGFVATAERLVLPERVAGALEQELEDLYASQGEAINQSFEDFRRERLAGMGDEAEEAADPANNPLAPALNAARETNKEIAKFDAALASSAEAITRVAEYNERNRRQTATGSVASGGVAPASPAPVTRAEPRVAPPASPGTDLGTSGERGSVVGLLTRIAVAIEAAPASGRVVLQTANL